LCVLASQQYVAKLRPPAARAAALLVQDEEIIAAERSSGKGKAKTKAKGKGGAKVKQRPGLKQRRDARRAEQAEEAREAERLNNMSFEEIMAKRADEKNKALEEAERTTRRNAPPPSVSKPPAKGMGGEEGGKGGKGQIKTGTGKAGARGAAGAAEEKSKADEEEEADAVVCGHCGISESGDTFSRCARCKLVVYCSAACQKVAWRSHKAVCRTQDEQAFVDPMEELLRERAPPDFKCPIWYVHMYHKVVNLKILSWSLQSGGLSPQTFNAAGE